MRSIRGLLIILALVALVPEASYAQEARPFRNSWFWGIKGGQQTFATPAATNQMANTLGIDWLITRSRGAIYVSYDQGFMNTTTPLYVWRGLSDTVYVMPAALGGTDTLTATLSNMRRFDAVGLLVPDVEYFRTRPYVGLGVSFSQVSSAMYPVDAFNVNEQFFLDEEVKRVRTNVAPVAMIGVQTELKYISAFAQVSGITTRQDFLLKGAAAGSIAYSFGLRYNLGTSIERDIR